MKFSFPFCNLLSCCSTFHRGSALMRWWSADLEKTTPDDVDDDPDLVFSLLYLFSTASSSLVIFILKYFVQRQLGIWAGCSGLMEKAELPVCHFFFNSSSGYTQKISDTRIQYGNRMYIFIHKCTTSLGILHGPWLLVGGWKLTNKWLTHLIDYSVQIRRY